MLKKQSFLLLINLLIFCPTGKADVLPLEERKLNSPPKKTFSEAALEIRLPQKGGHSRPIRSAAPLKKRGNLPLSVKSSGEEPETAAVDRSLAAEASQKGIVLFGAPGTLDKQKGPVINYKTIALFSGLQRFSRQSLDKARARQELRYKLSQENKKSQTVQDLTKRSQDPLSPPLVPTNLLFEVAAPSP